MAVTALLTLPLAPSMYAGERPARAVRGVAGGAPTTAAASWVDLLRALWLGDEHSGYDGHGNPPPRGPHTPPDPPPEGSGLCPHGQH